MPVYHKGAISFGLVHIPVALYTATQDNDIRFNQLCKEDNSRVKYKKVCAGCGKEVDNKEIIKGFEFEKGQYVTVSDADFEKIKTEKDKTLHILHFTDSENIPPIYYEKSFYVVPETGGEKAYVLLQQAMARANKVAVAKTVLGTKETLLVIAPAESGLLINTLYFADEIKDLPKDFAAPAVKESELKIAEQLISSMEEPFVPEAYHDEYRARLKTLIADKIAGRDIKRPPREKENNIIDLMDALKQSVQQSKPKQAAKSKSATKAKPTAKPTGKKRKAG